MSLTFPCLQVNAGVGPALGAASALTQPRSYAVGRRALRVGSSGSVCALFAGGLAPGFWREGGWRPGVLQEERASLPPRFLPLVVVQDHHEVG